MDVLDLVDIPEVTLTVGGPDRWRGNYFSFTLHNGYDFGYRVPEGFADGDEDETVLIPPQFAKKLA